MSLLSLLHLSDFHIADQSHLIPPERIIATFGEVPEKIDAVLVLITGDIAWSGREEEYEIATHFFEKLKKQLKEEVAAETELLAVPGNHDCFFPRDSELRRVVIKHCREKHPTPDRDMLSQCIAVQDNFMGWLSDVTRVDDTSNGQELIRVENLTILNSLTISILCLNTSWMSTMHERQGDLFFPIPTDFGLANQDLLISILHHPYNWFQAQNARDLRHFLETHSDVILTGHEHESDASIVTKMDTATIHYVEGHIYNAEGVKQRDFGFNQVLVDVEQKQYQIRPYKWSGTLFSTSDDAKEWKRFVRNMRCADNTSVLSDEMVNYLADPGVKFTHHAKEIEFDDIYITPNLRSVGPVVTSQ